MDISRREQAQRFYERHKQAGCFIVPNAWDIGSAKMLEAAGFPAIATTSAGIAFSLGRPDHGFCPPEARIDRASMLERVRSIADAIAIPLSADLEAGYGKSPESVAETIVQAIAAGAAGGNVEDYTGERDEPLYEFALAVERIRAARAAVDHSRLPFVLVARTDCFQIDPANAFAECVRRANAFREAGADCIFIPGVSDRDTIAKLVSAIDAPINIVMGLTGNSLSFADLKALGVRRITIGASLARALYHRIWQAAKEMLERGTFSFAETQMPQSELNRIFEHGPARRRP